MQNVDFLKIDIKAEGTLFGRRKGTSRRRGGGVKENKGAKDNTVYVWRCHSESYYLVCLCDCMRVCVLCIRCVCMCMYMPCMYIWRPQDIPYYSPFYSHETGSF